MSASRGRGDNDGKADNADRGHTQHGRDADGASFPTRQERFGSGHSGRRSFAARSAANARRRCSGSAGSGEAASLSADLRRR